MSFSKLGGKVTRASAVGFQENTAILLFLHCSPSCTNSRRRKSTKASRSVNHEAIDKTVDMFTKSLPRETLVITRGNAAPTEVTEDRWSYEDSGRPLIAHESQDQDALVDHMVDVLAVRSKPRPKPSRPSKQPLWSAAEMSATNWPQTLKRQNRTTDMVRSTTGAPFKRDSLPHFDATSRRKDREWIEHNMPRHMRDAMEQKPAVDSAALSALDIVVPKRKQSPSQQAGVR
ncbi:hypothetical protein DFH06DRAFT_1292734 [Mycena polygramma]|nr:hypothetical protein DFH06DRAFT_1292734 [Mycena polygramma]